MIALRNWNGVAQNTPPNAVLSTSSEHSTSAGIREIARVIGMEMFMIYRHHRCNYCRSSVWCKQAESTVSTWWDLLQQIAKMLHRRMSQFGPSRKCRDVRVVSEMGTTTDIDKIGTPGKLFSVSAAGDRTSSIVLAGPKASVNGVIRSPRNHRKSSAAIHREVSMGVNLWRRMFADRTHFMGDVNEKVRAGDRRVESSARKAASIADFAALTAPTDKPDYGID
jgi:hypothetical protein